MKQIKTFLKGFDEVTMDVSHNDDGTYDVTFRQDTSSAFTLVLHNLSSKEVSDYQTFIDCYFN